MSAWDISAFLNCANVAKLSPLIYSTLVPTSLAGCAAGWHARKRAPAMRIMTAFQQFGGDHSSGVIGLSSGLSGVKKSQTPVRCAAQVAVMHPACALQR